MSNVAAIPCPASRRSSPLSGGIRAHRTSHRLVHSCGTARGVRCACLFVLLLLLLHAHLSSATTTLPLTELPYLPFEYSQPLLNFAFNEASVNVNQEVFGLTIQVALEDCRQGTRWYLRPMAAINASSAALEGGVWSTLNATYDATLCAIFIVPSGGNTAVSVGTLLAAARTLWFRHFAADPLIAAPSGLRISWTYWIDQRFVMSVAETQHMYYCSSSTSTNLNYGDAVTACQQWLQDPGDITSIGASVAALYTPRVQDMVDTIRRRVSAQYIDPTNGIPVGYVTLIGLFGTRSQWDTGRALTFKNFAVANPAGSFPTVFDQDNVWKSVLSAEPFPYCCESSGIGPLQDIANGFVSIKSASNASSTAAKVLQQQQQRASLHQTMRVVKHINDSYFDPFYPFLNLSMPDPDPLHGGVPLFGFTASFHREDCDGAFRFVVDASAAANGSLFAATFHDDVCSVHLTQRATTPVALPPASFLEALRRVKVVDMRGPNQVATGQDPAAAAAVLSRRIIWGFLVGDNTQWTMGFDTIPHYYMCTWGSKSFQDADAACGALAGGWNEAYLATPQYAWEQQLLEDLSSQGNLTYDNVWIGLDLALGANVFSNGDPMGFTNWGINQPSLAYATAALSSINSKWASRSRTSQLSYCCEMNSDVSRNASGIVYVTLASSVDAPQRGVADDTSRVAVVQQLRAFRPFLSFEPRLSDASVAATSAYGVTIQLAREQCAEMYAFGGALSLPTLRTTTNVLTSPFMMCPSPLERCAGVPAATVPVVQALHHTTCAWYLARSDNASATYNVSTWLRVLSTAVELQVVRLPLHPFRTTVGKGRMSDVLRLGWSFWTHPPSLAQQGGPATPPRIAISPTVSFYGARASWPASRMMVDVTSGGTFLCPSPYGSGIGLLRASFVQALDICRDWADDAYLASITSVDEQWLLRTARNLSHFSNASAAAVDLPSVWIGLQRNRTQWVNGDARTFTNWAASEPADVGPTLMLPNGQWKNTPILASPTALPQQAAFCCKRNGYNQNTARMMGVLTVVPATVSSTVSAGSPTPSSAYTASAASHSPTATWHASASQLKLSASSSISERHDTITVGETKTQSASFRQTTSAQRTTRPPTRTLTLSLSAEFASQSHTPSQAVTNWTSAYTASGRMTVSRSPPTLTTTVALPAIARVDWEHPASMHFTAADIRSSDASRRQIVLEAVFTEFVAFLDTRLPLTQFLDVALLPSSPSLLHPSHDDFAQVGGAARFLASAVSPPNASATLVIVLARVENYFPVANEVLALRVKRNATTMTPDQFPLTLPEMQFTIQADDASTTVALYAVTTALAVLSLASPAAVRDQQFAYMIGAEGRCSRARAQQFAQQGLRVVSPAHWDETDRLSLWVGAGAIPVACMVVHICVWVVHMLVTAAPPPPPRSPRRATVALPAAPPLPSSASSVYFPSLTVLVIRTFFVGFASQSIILLLDGRNAQGDYDVSSVAFIGGASALSFLVAVTIGVLVWTQLLRSCIGPVFVHFSQKHRGGQTSAVQFIASRGYWTGHSGSLLNQSFWWICGEYTTLWWVLVEWMLAWFMAWAVTYAPSEDVHSKCTVLYAVLGALFLVVMVVAVLVSAHAAPLQTALAAMAYGVLGAVCFCTLAQLSSPDGPSNELLAVLRWVLVVIGLLRSFAVVLAVQLAIPHPAMGSGASSSTRRLTTAQSHQTVDDDDAPEDPFFNVGGSTYRLENFKFPQDRSSFARANSSSRGGRDYDNAMLMLDEMMPPGGSMLQERTTMVGAPPPPPPPAAQQHQRGGRNRMFSMGSMRRFGSYAARLSVPNITVQQFDSDGDSSSSSLPRSDGETRTRPPSSSTNMERTQQQHPPRVQQHHNPPPPMPTMGTAGTTATHQRGQESVAGERFSGSPQVAVRLSSLFSPSSGEPNRQRRQGGGSSVFVEDPFEGIPVVAEVPSPMSSGRGGTAHASPLYPAAQRQEHPTAPPPQGRPLAISRLESLLST